jgi:RHS repeat-associated protein
METNTATPSKPNNVMFRTVKHFSQERICFCFSGGGSVAKNGDAAERHIPQRAAWSATCLRAVVAFFAFALTVLFGSFVRVGVNPPVVDPAKPIYECGEVVGYSIGCIQFAQPFGKGAFTSASNVAGRGDGFIKLFRMKPTPDLYDPSILYYTGADGQWIRQDETSNGTRTFWLLDNFGEYIKYAFSPNASVGVPQGKYVCEPARAYLLDAAGNVVATTTNNNAVYLELRFADSSRLRYSLETRNVVATGDATGRFIARAEIPDAARVDIVRNGDCLRQIKAAEGVADITSLNNEADLGFVIKFYGAAQVGAKINGLYTLTGAPYRTITFFNPEPDNPNPLRMKIVDVWGTRQREYVFLYQETLDDWQLTRGTGASKESKELISQPGANPRVYQRVLRDANGSLVSKVLTTELTGAWGGVVETNKTIDPTGLNYQINSTYNLAAGTAGYTKLLSQTKPDGSWLRNVYDAQNRLWKQITPWKDSPAGAAESAARVVEYLYSPHDATDIVAANDTRPRTVVERICGMETRRTFYVYGINSATGERYKVEERAAAQGAAYGATGNPRTTTTYYANSAGIASAGRVKTIQFQDNTLTSYSYAFADGEFTTTQTQGTAAAPAGIANKTLRKVRKQNAAGNVVQEQTQIFTGSDYATINTTQHAYTADGFLSQTTRDGRVVFNATYNGGLKTSETDETGMVKNYEYDVLDRVETETRVAAGGGGTDIVTTYNRTLGGLDCGCDANLEITITGGNLSLTSTIQKDQVGRITNQTDTTGLTTTTAFTYGGRVSTTMQPNNALVVRENYLDGQTKSVTGTGVVPRFETCGINADGTQWTQTNLVSANGPRWTRTTTDFLGRVWKIEKPGFGTGVVITQSNAYNSLGQLASQTTSTTGGVAATATKNVSFAYNEVGEQISSTTIFGTTPPVANHSTQVYQQANGVWCSVTVSGVSYSESGQTKTVVNNISRRQLSGFTGDTVSYSETYAPPLTSAAGGALPVASALANLSTFANKTTQTTTITRGTKTVVATTLLPTATQPEIQTSVNGLLVSSVSSTTGGTTLYQHDALARRTGTKQPRHTNYATVTYNEFGQVGTFTDAAGNATTYTYYANGTNGAGKVFSETNALGYTTYHEYNTHYNETRTWGSATYPVAQDYNDYGERILLRTFRDTNAIFSLPVFPSVAGDTTTWTFDEATGVLLHKTYADGKGPTYDYYADGLLKRRMWARKDANNDPLYTDYAYTPQGRLAVVDYSDNTPDVAYTYHPLGQRATITDGSGTRTFAYNELTQSLAQETFSGIPNATLARAYDNYVRPTGYVLTTAATPTVATTAVTYNYAHASGLLYQVLGDTVPTQLAANNYATTSLTPSTFTYNRLANSELLASVVGPVHTVYNTYEPNRDVLTSKQNKVTVGANANINNGVVSQYDYTINAIGQRTSRSQSGIAFTTPSTDTFLYNPRGEVTGSINSANPAYNRGYAYDPIGNRLIATDGLSSTPTTARTYTSNSLNQYTEIQTTQNTPPPPTTTTAAPTYDDDGNMLTDGTGKTFLWDCENRLIQVNLPNGEIVHYFYDAGFRSVKRQHITSTKTETTTYLYDGWDVICAAIATTEYLDGGVASTLSRRIYIWDVNLSNLSRVGNGMNSPFAMKYIADMSSCNATTFVSYTYGGNGNVSELIDTGGAIAGHYEYDVFGGIAMMNGNLSVVNEFCFASRQYDRECNLYSYGFRYYGPSLGLWLIRDFDEDFSPAGLYVFVENNAVSKIDYMGTPKNEEI